MKHTVINIFVLLALFTLQSCRDDSEAMFDSNNGQAFCTLIQAWGENDNKIQTRSNINKHEKIQFLPVEEDDNVQIMAITGDGMENVKSLGQRSNTDIVNPDTRATTKEEITSTDQFKISAYYTDIANNEQTLINQQEIQKTYTSGGVDYWKLTGENVQYWKLGRQAITTYAWWPITGVTYNDTGSGKYFTNYMVDTDVINQKDLLYAKEGPQYYITPQPANLNFKHALTAVRFIMGEGLGHKDDETQPGTVTKIELKNIAYKGTFNIDTEEWDVDYSLTRNFVLTMSNPPEMQNKEENVVLNPNEYTLLMMPQDLSKAATEVIFTMGDGRTFRATLNHSDEWLPGTTVQYKLVGSLSQGYIIYASSVNADYNGTGGSISVTSYELDGNTTKPVGWKVTGYSIDNGQTWNDINVTTWTGNGVPSVKQWITGTYTGKGTGTGANPVTTPLTMKKNDTPTKSGKGQTINDNLYSATSVSNYDLSQYNTKGVKNTGSKKSTANCYIVHAPGTYKFPAVYGNSIVNDDTNSDAYSQTNFTNALGNAISSPNILTDTGVDAANVEAKLVWYENAIKSAITDVNYDTSTNYISFTVNKSKIYQGNAVIGLYDKVNKYYLWSWHIWISRAYMDYPDVTLTDGSNTYTYAPDHLGTIYMGRQSVYESRSVMLRIQQVDESGTVIRGSSSCRVSVSHGSNSEDNRMVAFPFWQWGRKDPRPSSYNRYNPSYYYTGDNANGYSGYSMKGDAYGWYAAGAQIEMADAIKHPDAYKQKFDSTPTSAWIATVSYNWWNGNLTTFVSTKGHEAVKKTIYDPCPVGYHMPPSGAFKWFTETNSTFYADIDPNNADRVLLRWREFTIGNKTLQMYYTGYTDGTSGGMLYLNYMCLWTGAPRQALVTSANTFFCTTNPPTFITTDATAGISDAYAVHPVHD